MQSPAAAQLRHSLTIYYQQHAPENLGNVEALVARVPGTLLVSYTPAGSASSSAAAAAAAAGKKAGSSISRTCVPGNL